MFLLLNQVCVLFLTIPLLILYILYQTVTILPNLIRILMPWPKEFSLQELLAVSWNACRSTPKTPPSWVGPVEISLPLRGLLPSLSSGLVEWDLIPDGFLGHPSFMMFYWFVRDSKIFQVSGNWISGSRCWSLVDILQSSLLVIHNHSWENLFEWQPRCFFPLQGAHEFFWYSCKTG